MVRLAYLLNHPIQYQAPFSRLLVNEPQVHLADDPRAEAA